MHIISRKRLKDFWERHPTTQTSLLLWYKITRTAHWQTFAELREVFPSADQVKNFTVFNIGGNKARLIAFVDYNKQKVFVRHILTHADYDKQTWKQDDWYQ